MPNVLILTEVQEAMRARYKAMLLERFPQLTINVVGHHNDVGPYIADTDILLCFSPPMADHVVRDAPKLKWIQALGTGVDNIVDLPSLGQEVIVTNVRGIHGAPVSEATIAYMLSLARDLPRSARAQDKAPVGALAVAAARRQDRRHSRRRADRRISGADLQAVRHDGDRHQRQPARDAKASTAWLPRNDLLKIAGELDYLVALAPLTPETRGIVGDKLLAAMKPTAYLVNVARGGVVDEQALIEALEAGQIAGAALDVFAQEPLPADDPIWRAKNVTIFSASRRLFARLRRPRHADHRRQHGQVSRQRSQEHDQYRAQARLLGSLKSWLCPNA